MQSLEDILQAIKKPFLFLSKSSFRKVESVKDLRLRTISLVNEGFASTNDPEKTYGLRKIIEIFENYESLSLEDKTRIIMKTLEIIENIESGRDFIDRTYNYYREEKHKDFDKKTFNEYEAKLMDRAQYLKGVGPKISEKFEKAGIYTTGDLLYFFPWRYEDRRKMLKINELEDDVLSTFVAEIADIHMVYYRGKGRGILEVLLTDETGKLKAKWFNFNRSYFENKMRIGSKAIFTGKVKNFKGKRELYHPEFEIFGKKDTDMLSFGRVVPVYTEVGGLYQKVLRKIMYTAVNLYSKYKICVLPKEICKRYDLMSPDEALSEIHFPNNLADSLLGEGEGFIKSEAYRSIIFSELFIFNLLIGLKKRKIDSKQGISIKVDEGKVKDFILKLPYKLTDSQDEVLREIKDDLSMAKPMNRLLQGDVGSGKTVIALISALIVMNYGYQAAFMAPTEILAEQIYGEALKLFGKTEFKVGLLLGAQDEKTKIEGSNRIKDGEINLIVGTHALIQEGVAFNKLGLAIVDEQHRFGVLQRGAIMEKGEFPHVLVMSATPIPRTLALTYYGDLDISTIRELPKGRKPILTRLVNDQSRAKLYDFIKSELKKGRQAYIIYPIIEESSKINLLDATRMAKYLSQNIFPSFRLELIHGRLSSEKKEKIMSDFRSGRIDLLVSTTVIEVGIDVPNATVMVIEHPERFGLSQLHQLRGRVGRGAHKSYCFLLLGIDSEVEIKDRLIIFRDTLDGFKLAEEDLRLRGPGDFFGISQSGLPPFRVAKFPRDLDLLKVTREEAFALLKRDYNLTDKANELLPELIKKSWKDKLDLLQVG